MRRSSGGAARAYGHPAVLEAVLARRVVALGLLAACGGDADAPAADAGSDAASVDAGAADAATGVAHAFVVSRLDLPTSGGEARDLGLDVDGKPDDGNQGIDNSIGAFLASLSAVLPSVDTQGAADAVVATGQLVQLLEVHAGGLDAAEHATLRWYQGDDEFTPAACSGPDDAICGRHLAGSGVFAVASTGGELEGSIAGATLAAGPGELTVVVPIFGGRVPLPLRGARAELAGLTEAGFASGKIGGAVAEADLEATVFPAIAAGVRTAFDAGCEDGGLPPQCGCTGDGATLQGLFDDSPEDCAISDAEVESFLSPLLMRDVDLDGDATNDAASVGIGVSAVAGAFSSASARSTAAARRAR